MLLKRILLFNLTLMFVIGVNAQTPTADNRKLVPVISQDKRVELAPTISADGRTMIFETQNEDKWELYQSTLSDAGQWNKPVALTAINEKCNFIAGPSLSYDGNLLVYTAFIEDVTQSEDIFYSTRLSDTQWSEPKSIGSPINTDDGYEGFPSISANGESLYFIRINPENDIDKKSKEPCFTIYVSHKNEEGKWKEPTQLPQPVNSGCERDPRIMADNHTLIFSSIRPEGKGKYDLYQTRLEPKGTWAPPIALGYVNSLENDQSPCISASGSTMFYYSKDDIYQVEIPKEYRQLINVTVQGKVTAEKSKLPLETVITVKNLGTGETFVTESSPVDGKYSIVLSAGQSYDVMFTHDAYVPERRKFDYTTLETYKEEKISVGMVEEFSFAVDVRDEDLKDRAVKSFVTLKSLTGETLFNDSLFTATTPLTVTLLPTKKYELTVQAKNFVPYKKELDLSPATMERVMKQTVYITQEKIAFVADVTDIGTGDRKRVKVTYNNETTNEVIIADAGEVVNLRKGDRYQVVTNSDKGYAYAMKSIMAGEGRPTENGTYSVGLGVLGLTKGAKLTLNNIYFEFNSAELNSASALELNTIVTLLQKNPQITIEISAHTDDVGSDDYNNGLSQKRANSVVKYLSEKKIPVKQLVAKGYGKTSPVVPNDSDENRAMNRRVELLVLKAE